MTTRHPRYYESLGRAITLLRTEQGLDRKDLAEKAGISYSYLAEIENGNKPPSSRVLIEIAQALGLGLSQLMASAESLLRRQEGETVVAPMTPAAAQVTPAPPPPATRSWFRDSEQTMARLVETNRERLLGELIALAQGLPDPDLELVVDLARRLRG